MWLVLSTKFFIVEDHIHCLICAHPFAYASHDEPNETITVTQLESFSYFKVPFQWELYFYPLEVVPRQWDSQTFGPSYEIFRTSTDSISPINSPMRHPTLLDMLLKGQSYIRTWLASSENVTGNFLFFILWLLFDHELNIGNIELTYIHWIQNRKFPVIFSLDVSQTPYTLIQNAASVSLILEHITLPFLCLPFLQILVSQLPKLKLSPTVVILLN